MASHDHPTDRAQAQPKHALHPRANQQTFGAGSPCQWSDQMYDGQRLLAERRAKATGNHLALALRDDHRMARNAVGNAHAGPIAGLPGTSASSFLGASAHRAKHRILVSATWCLLSAAVATFWIFALIGVAHTLGLLP